MDNRTPIDSKIITLYPRNEERYKLKRKRISSLDDPRIAFKENLDKILKRREKYKKIRKISKKLVDKCSKIKKLHYRKLFPQLSEIIRLKQENTPSIVVKADDEDILAAAYCSLGDIIGEFKYDTYHKLLEDYDYILKNDPSYRDHLFHTFHVFLIGCVIIDALYDEVSKYHENQNKIPNNLLKIEDSWLLISTFHDIAIPIQNAEKMILSLTGNFYSLDANKKYFDIMSLLDSNDRKQIKSNIIDILKLISLKLNKPLENPEILGCQSHELLYKLNHAILGSTFLINSIAKSDKDKRLDPNDINNLGLPIFIHDYKIWKHFPENSISLNKFPLGFILIFCDNIQDFNRYNEFNEQFKGFVEILHINYNKNKKIFKVELGYSDRFCFERKCSFTKNVVNVLNSGKIDFQIILYLLDTQGKKIDKQEFSTLIKKEIDDKDREWFKIKNVNC
jgi:hypothetical protein